MGWSWAVLGRPWGVLGGSWGVLSRSWGDLGRVLGGSWAVLGCHAGARRPQKYWKTYYFVQNHVFEDKTVRRRFWDAVKATKIALGGVLGRLGGILGGSWDAPGRSWGVLARCWHVLGRSGADPGRSQVLRGRSQGRPGGGARRGQATSLRPGPKNPYPFICVYIYIYYT